MNVKLRAGARRMLQVLARNRDRGLSRQQLATLAFLKSKSGTFSTYLGELRRAGLMVEAVEGLVISERGLAWFGGVLPESLSSREVLQQWRDTFRAGARRMLDALTSTSPNPMTRLELAQAAALEVTSGTFSTYLGDIRRAGLLEEAGDVIFLNKEFVG